MDGGTVWYGCLIRLISPDLTATTADDGPSRPRGSAAAVAGRLIHVPNVQAVHMDYWIAKQACLSAMVCMLAARAAGLATCPLEGFGERGVRRALGIPSSQAVILA